MRHKHDFIFFLNYLEENEGLLASTSLSGGFFMCNWSYPMKYFIKTTKAISEASYILPS